MDRFCKWLDNFEEYFLFITLSVMLVLTFAEVLSRYLFHFSIAFSEEITVNLFAWSIMVGSGAAAKRNAHVGFSLITDMLPAWLRRWILLLISLICAFVMLLFVYYGIEMVMSQIEGAQRTAVLELPEWLMGLSIPVGAVLCAIRFCQAGHANWEKLGKQVDDHV